MTDCHKWPKEFSKLANKRFSSLLQITHLRQHGASGSPGMSRPIRNAAPGMVTASGIRRIQAPVDPNQAQTHGQKEKSTLRLVL